MQDLRREALAPGGFIETAVVRSLETLARGEAIEPSVVRLLLRWYAMTGSADLEEPLGAALALALDVSEQSEQDEATRPGWLLVMVEAASVSDDERLAEAGRAMESGIRRCWPASQRAGQRGFVADARSIDACLRAADLQTDDAARRVGIGAAVDELERIVGPRYRPGEGLVDADGTRGDLCDHVGAASALLSAYERTGRLPYSMLAEELMRFARRTFLSDQGSSERVPQADGALTEAVGVLCRLATLHVDEEYRQAAVIAPDSDYMSDAEGLLKIVTGRLEGQKLQDLQALAAAADCGVALLDWLAHDASTRRLDADE